MEGVSGGRLVLGTAERLEVRWLDTAGRVEQIARVPAFDLSIPADEMERERAFFFGLRPSPERAAYLDAMPVLTERPAYAALVGDPTGAVWAAPHTPYSDPDTIRPWQIFARSGEWLGPLRLPHRFRPLDIGADYVLGVQPDSLDVERVHLLGLHRR